MEENSTLYHCKLTILRPGDAYGLRCKTVKSTLRLFFDRTKLFMFSIGGGDDYIHVKGLLPEHLEVSASDNAFTFAAKGNAKILFNRREQDIKAGETKSLDWDIKRPMDWQITFPNKTVLNGEIRAEMEDLQPEAKAYLEKKYGPVQKIQEGNSCLIYKTKDQKVLKILKPSFIENKQTAGIIQRFINAAKRFGAINSNYLLGLQEIVFRRQLDLAYVATRYFAGECLENYLARKGILSLNEAKNITTSIARNLLIFQKKGHACRSLSPDNVMIGERGKVVLTSFLLLKSEDFSLTNTGEQMITPLYTSPEQVEDATSVDIISDMFSLGMVYYALMAGQPYFKSEREHIEYAHNHKPLLAEEIQNSAPHIPINLCQIVASLLHPDKNKRPGPQSLIQQLSLLPKLQTRVAPLNEDTIAIGEDKTVVDTQSMYQEETPLDTDPLMNPVESKFVAVLNETAQMPKNRGEHNAYSVEILSGPSGTYHKEYNLVGDQTIVIGREGDLCITTDPGISRQHARLEISQGKCVLVDLKSQNGTIVHGKKISCMEIDSGTKFTIASTVFLFKKTHASIDDKEWTEEDLKEIQDLTIFTMSTLHPVLPGETKQEEPAAPNTVKMQIEEAEKRMVEKEALRSAKKKKGRFWQTDTTFMIKSAVSLTLVCLIIMVITVFFYVFAPGKPTTTPISVPVPVSVPVVPTVVIVGQVVKVYDGNLKRADVCPIQNPDNICVVIFPEEFRDVLKNAEKQAIILQIEGVSKKLTVGAFPISGGKNTSEFLELRKVQAK